jgi:hypothetical protein
LTNDSTDSASYAQMLGWSDGKVNTQASQTYRKSFTFYFRYILHPCSSLPLYGGGAVEPRPAHSWKVYPSLYFTSLLLFRPLLSLSKLSPHPHDTDLHTLSLPPSSLYLNPSPHLPISLLTLLVYPSLFHPPLYYISLWYSSLSIISPLLLFRLYSDPALLLNYGSGLQSGSESTSNIVFV